jgi:hypothetical protein
MSESFRAEKVGNQLDALPIATGERLDANRDKVFFELDVFCLLKGSLVNYHRGTAFHV